MVDEVRQRLEALNATLDGVSPYRFGVASPDDFAPAQVNARFMRKNQYDQLVKNIRQDGNLSSLPFCHREADGTLRIVSGHHRIQAAKDAGVGTVLYLYTDRALTDGQRTAMQISHNAIAGEDDLAVLKSQWDSIRSIEDKLYSGLDDNVFKGYDPVSLGLFGEKDLSYQKIEFLFLPAEVEALTKAMDKLGKTKHPRFATDLALFDRFADAFIRFKEASNIVNSSVALMAMVRVAELYCDFFEEQQRQLEGAELADEVRERRIV